MILLLKANIALICSKIQKLNCEDTASYRNRLLKVTNKMVQCKKVLICFIQVLEEPIISDCRQMHMKFVDLNLILLM